MRPVQNGRGLGCHHLQHISAHAAQHYHISAYAAHYYHISAYFAQHCHISAHAAHYSTLMVILPMPSWGAILFHTAWLFLLMPLPTESLFYSHFSLVIKMKKETSILGNSSFVSIYYQSIYHYGHHADCQLALTNVVEVEMKLGTLD